MKQKIAAEMNLSETAFVVPIITEQLNISEPFEKSSRFNLRWFTPTTEVPLCGHATLASAAVLFYAKNNQNVSFSHNRYRYKIFIDQSFFTDLVLSYCTNLPKSPYNFPPMNP